MNENKNLHFKNVLSLCDGMSVGQLALKKAGITYDNYFASEIDKSAIKVTQHNFPNTIQLGDINNVFGKDLPEIDLVLGGVPCTSFSFAGKQLNFSDPRGKLVFEYVRLLEECKPKYFLLENVVMQKQFENVISKLMGVIPEKIDSALVSAQTRKRLYWANFPITQPKDRNIQLKDILEYDGNEYRPAALRGVMNKKTKSNVIVSDILNEDEKKEQEIIKSPSVKTKSYVTHLVVRPIQKAYCLTTVDMSSVLTTMSPGSHPDAFGRKLPYRKYTLKELCRLQTVPDDYFDGVASLNQAKKMLGNGWNVDTIVHILEDLKNIAIK